MHGFSWAWCEPPPHAEKRTQFQMLSFNIDPQWCGLLFSVYCRHERSEGLLGLSGPVHSDVFAYSVAGPPLDADLIAWAGSFGFEICSLASTCDLIFETVKTTGVLLFLGFSGLLCYKLLNGYWPRSRSRTNPKQDDSSSCVPIHNHEDYGIELIKGEYFGPAELSEDSNSSCRRQYLGFASGTESISPITCAAERTPLSLSLVSNYDCYQLRNNNTLPRDESFDSLGFSRRLNRDGSFDSNCSEMSLDFSLPELMPDTNTLLSLDKLQHEIDSLKSNCLMMDEEFETIKCNRNFPGMSSLLHANASPRTSTARHNASTLDEETMDTIKQEKARACFAGLYSLTTIKHSTSSDYSDSLPARGSLGSAESLDWDSPKTGASPGKYIASSDSEASGRNESASVEESANARKCSLGQLPEDFEGRGGEQVKTGSPRQKSSNSGARLRGQKSELNKSVCESEDELMENLEWDEEECPETDVLPAVGAEEELNGESTSWPTSPCTERSSKMDSSGFGSQMTDSMLVSEMEPGPQPLPSWAGWSSDESSNMEWDETTKWMQYAQDEGTSSGVASAESTPAADLARLPGLDMSPTTEDAPNIGPRVDVLLYAAREWRGSTKTAQAMLEGYAEIPKRLNLEYLRRIRGDNYCGIRAALFQTLSQGLPVPSGADTFRFLSDAIHQPALDWLKEWSFADRLPYRGNNVLHGMESCLLTLDKTVSSLAATASCSERADQLAALLNGRPGVDLHLVEAVKLHMLRCAMQLHDAGDTTHGGDLPLFAVLMFARDTCQTPRDLMNNHLRHVGNTAGLEQVEMFLLGYTLGVTLRVVRPTAHATQEFVSCYPDWHAGDWPQVVLIAEDDRHYNVLVN